MAGQQQPSTVYKGVTYVGKGSGTLKLHDEMLTFQMYDATAANNVKIFTLPWSKVKRRQVNSSEPTKTTTKGTTKPKIKLILHSGTEAVFQMEDRITLEVLRDDVAERLQRYKLLHPDSEDDEKVVNQTRSTQSDRRLSTPYRMVKPTTTSTAAAAAPITQPRAPQPYRMAAAPAATSNARGMPPQSSAKPMRRHSQPATNTQKTAASSFNGNNNNNSNNSNIGGTRQPQPYRMKQKEPTTEPRQSQPYRFAQKK